MLFSTAEMEAAGAAAPESAEATATAVEVPAEVEALDGIESSEEAHNSERPARKSLKKKGPRGKALSELSIGETVEGRVKTITAYGAFLDIGAQTDGLLHISQLAAGFVSDVNEVLTVGQEVQARILSIDEAKSQVALTLLTEEQEQEAKDAQQARPSRQQRGERGSGGGGGGAPRRDDSATMSALLDKGWNTDQFVEGTVVSTVDFGAFVRVDASQLNSEVAGELDGLVHISCLTPGRANSVTSIVKADDKVQVRIKGIANRKVSLSMITAEQEQESQGSGGGGGGGSSGSNEGAKDWQESLVKAAATMPKFENRPLVVDRRN
jgi:predicted RNA-binding protein with RPS1 domain